MTGRVAVALDAGSASTRLALGGPGAPPVVESRPTPSGGYAVFLSKLLEAGRARAPGAIAGMTVTVPDAWLDGTPEGIRAYERLRRTVLDELGWPRVSWAGQAGCVAAEAMRTRPGEGPLLVCDLGARTVSAALCTMSGGTAMLEAVAVTERGRGGGLAFDTAVEAAVPAARTGDFAAMFAGVRARQGRRAAVVLPRAWTHPRYRDTPVYRIGEMDLTAGTLIDAFAGTAAALKDVVERVGGTAPATVAIAGRFGVFPLVGRFLTDLLDLTGPPLVLGPSAAVRGALRIAAGEIEVSPPERPSVALPLHRVRHGLLEVRDVPLDPSADFAVQDGLPVLIEVPAESPGPFHVQVDGRDVAVRLPALPPGPYRVGLRPSHACAGVLVLAPAGGGELRLHPLAETPTEPR
ncbi:hypothetical protein [Actinomadura fibrosa]|uniref:Hsp70 family protein n=1 Tax=Actinomadura fibrosa TaxID=111802 RepID=A0ABW2XE84_9ACTN|nr:hypothetical protein [Actinomadura fibrosa]